MHFAPLWNHFNNGEYEQALACANRVDVPGLFWPYLVMASACGHPGRGTEASAAVRDLVALDPEFAAHARSNIGSWHFASGLMEPILEGLREVGLEIPAAKGRTRLHFQSSRRSTAENRAFEGEIFSLRSARLVIDHEACKQRQEAGEQRRETGRRDEKLATTLPKTVILNEVKNL